MILKVKLLGSGIDGDPYRVQLPTYQMLIGNIEQKFAYVSVPADVHGLSDSELKHEKVERTTKGPHYPELCASCIDKIHSHFEDYYQEHPGEYKVELA